MLEMPSKLAKAGWTVETEEDWASLLMTGWPLIGRPRTVWRKRMAGLWRDAVGGTWTSSLSSDLKRVSQLPLNSYSERE